MSDPGEPPDVLVAVLAKSGRAGNPPELLTQHLADTLAGARQLRRRVGQIAAVDAVLPDIFWSAVCLAALTHDAGKVPQGFQHMLLGRTRSWGERHEVLSLGFLPTLIDEPTLLSWVAIAVATHHRPMSGTSGRDLGALYGGGDAPELRRRIGPIDDQLVMALGRWLRETAMRAGLPTALTDQTESLASATVVEHAHHVLDDLFDQWGAGVAAERGLAAVLLQGAVTLSDHLSSAHGFLSTVQPLDDTYCSKLTRQLRANGRTLREHQLQAAAVEGHLLLRAPTGSGKTEAALLWAARQATELVQQTGGIPRVFFTLPYLSSINAMATRLGETLDNPAVVGVSHSRAASYHLAAAITAEDGSEESDDGSPCRIDAARKALSRAKATRLFQESVRVGTPYQLLRAALAGPAHSSILVDAANSVFILDELHAYDPQRLGYILASARLWERLGGRIAVMSATLPAVLAELFTETLIAPIAVVNTPNLGIPDRHRLCVRDYPLTDPAALDEIRQRLDGGQSVLVVANNVAHAMEIFTKLAPEVTARHGSDSAVLLHSRFRRKDRFGIEEKITKRFGTDTARQPGLLVATQVVEVSLDLDFDVLFTAGAPLEALLQRFGRTNRTAARAPAEVIVHHPSWTTRGDGGEYADGIYARDPVETGWQILTSHDGQVVNEADATGWLDAVYATDWGKQWRNEVINRRDEFDDVFLTFHDPFDDRSGLSEEFDRMFDGTEAILARDREDYAAALSDDPVAGRLLADEYLIPMPHWAAQFSKYERNLGVRIIDGEYEEGYGLLAVRGLAVQQTYQLGIVL
jgi:CRISPR-associated endonuclease/helicase Cas3